jgi:hypothetical protein
VPFMYQIKSDHQKTPVYFFFGVSLPPTQKKIVATGDAHTKKNIEASWSSPSEHSISVTPFFGSARERRIQFRASTLEVSSGGGKGGGKGGGEGAMSIGLWGMRESRRRRIKNSLFTHNSSAQIFPYKSPRR